VISKLETGLVLNRLSLFETRMRQEFGRILKFKTKMRIVSEASFVKEITIYSTSHLTVHQNVLLVPSDMSLMPYTETQKDAVWVDRSSYMLTLMDQVVLLLCRA
jgi:hypothetical protein